MRGGVDIRGFEPPTQAQLHGFNDGLGGCSRHSSDSSGAAAAAIALATSLDSDENGGVESGEFLPFRMSPHSKAPGSTTVGSAGGMVARAVRFRVRGAGSLERRRQLTSLPPPSFARRNATSPFRGRR